MDCSADTETVHCEVSFRKIEELENYGVNRVDISKLKSSGFHTLESLAHSTLKRIQEVKGISEQKATKLKVLISMNVYRFSTWMIIEFFLIIRRT